MSEEKGQIQDDAALVDQSFVQTINPAYIYSKWEMVPSSLDVPKSVSSPNAEGAHPSPS